MLLFFEFVFSFFFFFLKKKDPHQPPGLNFLNFVPPPGLNLLHFRGWADTKKSVIFCFAFFFSFFCLFLFFFIFLSFESFSLLDCLVRFLPMLGGRSPLPPPSCWSGNGVPLPSWLGSVFFLLGCPSSSCWLGRLHSPPRSLALSPLPPWVFGPSSLPCWLGVGVTLLSPPALTLSGCVVSPPFLLAVPPPSLFG